MSPAFALDPRLAADTHAVADLPLCRLLLMNDTRWPWLILVPRLAGARELIDLGHAAQQGLLQEIDAVSRALRELYAPHKLNVAALGNVVEQLHVHVIARYRDDPAWPAPVWGRGSAETYADTVLVERLAELRQHCRA
ncbi:MAG TPA: HIT family protein [Rhodanobacteraceae bacterium]|nr:HIT family protein [Rhodanobacteraceae bacterium]